MRALTIRQPYAWAVATGHKPIENRPGAFTYRGEVMIHAGQQLASRMAFDDVTRLAGLIPLLGAPASPTECAFGAVIAVADLVSAHPSANCVGECSPWAQRGKAHIRLSNPRILRRPVAAHGNTILWTPDADLVAEVRRVLC